MKIFVGLETQQKGWRTYLGPTQIHLENRCFGAHRSVHEFPKSAKNGPARIVKCLRRITKSSERGQESAVLRPVFTEAVHPR